MTQQKRENSNKKASSGTIEMTKEQLKLFEETMNEDAVIPYIIEFASPFDCEHFRVTQEGCRGNLLSNATQAEVIKFIAVDNYNAQIKQSTENPDV